jgi:hypothetical protein
VSPITLGAALEPGVTRKWSLRVELPDRRRGTEVPWG